ncbi:MAG: HAD family hydrolase [Pauljensenia sp.]
MTRKLVFLDVDGTLIDSHQLMPDSARAACQAAVDAGHILMLCTGRTVPEVYPWILETGMSGIVAGGGGYVRVGDEVHSDVRMDRGSIEEVTAELDALGADWVWQSPDSLNPSPGFLRVLTTSGSQGSWSAYAHQVTPWVREGLPQTSSKCTFTLPADHSVTVGGVIDSFQDRYHVIPGSMGPGGLTGELLPLGVDKGVGLLLATRLLGVDPADTVAIGDSENDLEMLEAAGTAVAMGNARESVKALADMVTGPVDEGGLAHAFQELGLV